MAAVRAPTNAPSPGSANIMASFPSQWTGIPYINPPPYELDLDLDLLSDYMLLDEGVMASPAFTVEKPQLGEVTCPGSSSSMRSDVEKERLETGFRIAFRTKSEVEIMDDGFKWRKYGKKTVKNSPNPRNYYRCSTEGCSVKKRVERDKDDHSYVITTYEGTHNHASPGVVYYAAQDGRSGRYFVAGCQMPPTS